MSLAGEFKRARGFGIGQRRDGKLQFLLERLAKIPLPRTETGEAGAVDRASPSVLIIGDGRENLFEHRGGIEDVRFGQHFGGAIDAEICAADDDRGERLAGHAGEQRGAALFEQRQGGQRGTQAR